MKTIALVDPFWTGHHATYLHFFSTALLQLGHRVVVLCPEPNMLGDTLAGELVKSNNWHTISLRLPEPSVNSRLSLRATARQRIEQIAQVLAETEDRLPSPIDLVFFCWLDEFSWHFLHGLDFDHLLGRRFSGLYFHPTHLRVPLRLAWLRRGPFNPDAVFRSSYCTSVAVLDEGITKALSRRLGKPVIDFPDITDERQSETPTALEIAIRTKARGRKVIGVLGSLDKRKGLLAIIQHAAMLQDQPILFCVAGTVVEKSFSAEENRVIRNWMDGPPENVFARCGFIEDGIAFNGFVRACDLLYAVYQDFRHSSNILTKAACLRVPIVVADGYLMAERVKCFHLGFVVREEVPQDFQSLVLSGRAFTYRGTQEFQQGCRDYQEQHGFAKLVAGFEQILAV